MNSQKLQTGSKSLIFFSPVFLSGDDSQVKRSQDIIIKEVQIILFDIHN
ncbi:hypothetical protein BH23BAC3_BH23BAC3_15400 [soil metagenome]